MPLKLAYGKTVHTFQGQNAGPTPPDKPPNAVKTIVVDPGTRSFEGMNVGLFYSIATRATTVGTCGGKRLDSALYFFGNNMSRHRILDLNLKKNGEPFLTVVNQKKWIDRLNMFQNKKTMPAKGIRKSNLHGAVWMLVVKAPRGVVTFAQISRANYSW